MIPNSDLLSGFDHVLDHNEKILWIEKPRYMPYLAAGFGLPFLVFFFLGIVGIYEATTIKTPNLGVYLMAPAFMGLSAWGFIRRRLDFKHVCYAWTNKRILIRSGIRGQKIKVIEYDNVVEVTMDTNSIERHYGAGSIKIFTGETTYTHESGHEKIYDKLEAVPDPYTVYRNLKDVMTDLKTPS